MFSGLIRKLAQRAEALHNTSSPSEDAGKQLSGKEVRQKNTDTMTDR